MLLLGGALLSLQVLLLGGALLNLQVLLLGGALLNLQVLLLGGALIDHAGDHGMSSQSTTHDTIARVRVFKIARCHNCDWRCVLRPSTVRSRCWVQNTSRIQN